MKASSFKNFSIGLSLTGRSSFNYFKHKQYCRFMAFSWFGTSGLLIFIVRGNMSAVSWLPGKVLAPYPKIGWYSSPVNISDPIILTRSRYWLGLSRLGVCTEVLWFEKVRFAMLKSINTNGHMWMCSGKRSIIESWDLSVVNGPVKKHFCMISYVLGESKSCSIFKCYNCV